MSLRGAAATSLAAVVLIAGGVLMLEPGAARVPPLNDDVDSFDVATVAVAATFDTLPGSSPLLRSDGDRITWHMNASPGAPPAVVGVVRAAMRGAGESDIRESAAALDVLSSHALTSAWALGARARRALAAGDTLRAEADLEAAAARPSAWQWQAAKLRHDLALARGDGAAARAALLEPDFWWGAEAAQTWRLLIARRYVAEADLEGATRLLAGADMGDFPEDSIGAALRLLDAIAAQAGDSLRQAAAHAAVHVVSRSRDLALRTVRLEAALELLTGRERFEAVLDLAGVLRRRGRTREARALLASLDPPGERKRADGAPAYRDSVDRARVLLNRAAVERSARRFDTADGLYARAARAAPWRSAAQADRAVDVRVYTLTLERRAGLAISRNRFRSARQIFDAWPAGLAGSADAAFNAAMLSLLVNDRDGALSRLAGMLTPEALFWRARLTRRSNAAAADSLLDVLAARDGFDYYVAAARDDPARAPGVPRPADVRPGSGGPEWLRACELFAWLGLGEEALPVLDAALEWRRTAGAAAVGNPTDAHWLRAARVAYLAHAPELGIRLAHRAYWNRTFEERTFPRASVVPWLYPPAFDSLFVVNAESNRLDSALLMAIGWQESFFEAGVVSRAGALGVMQFMPTTARGVARQLGEGPPSESDMFVPERSIRYGAHYFAGLLRQFANRVPPALAAYNAGPGPARRWVRRANGDTDALFCEVIGFDETVNYVKNILGAWQAYGRYEPRWVP